MTDLEKLAAAAVASLVVHVAIERGLERLPPRAPPAEPKKLAIQLVEPPRKPPLEVVEPPKPPEPKPDPTPPKVVHEPPRVHAPAQHVAAKPIDTPPPDRVTKPSDSNDEPVFGVTMESTSQGGHGPAVPVGNTSRPTPGAGSAAHDVKPPPEPVAAFEATKMPLPRGDCSGKYTDDALAAGIEGTVVLDVVVGENGRVRDVAITSRLGHGLDEAAVTAIRACQFTPGEKDGKPVAVKVRGFKIRFVLPER